MATVTSLSHDLGIKPACDALGVNRALFYRAKALPAAVSAPRPRPPLALPLDIEQRLLDVLHSERFMDASPYQVYATLLDEGEYLCSIRTMYRLLARHGEVRERRALRRHPAYAKPELLATAPNQVWSWDITQLKAQTRLSYFHLYVILDIFSRYVVGWLLASQESADLATRLIEETCARQGITEGQLKLHADRGSSMTSKSVEQLLIDLDVAKSHSRPYVSNDNPYSEAQFKTLKYRPEFPERFNCIEDARAHCRRFFDWYNHAHYHAGIALLTPHSVHFGQAESIIARRNAVLADAFARHPERFKGRPPTAGALPKAVWINPPANPSTAEVTQPDLPPDTDLLH